MNNIEVLISKEGNIKALQSYILIMPNTLRDGVELYADATLYEYAMATVGIYDTFLKEASTYSDQELYEMCDILDMDYANLIELVRGYRDNA